MLVVPKLGLKQVVVEGTGHDQLTRGPGHYPATGVPGSRRTIAIAGHRTTWGAPFRHLDRLQRGDTIVLCGARYLVRRVFVVVPNDLTILKNRGERLILTTCNPPYSAAQRLVVEARRDEEAGRRR
jgi:sortase A